MGFAYVSKSEDLHVVADKETAVEYSRDGNIIETDLPFAGGYLQYEKERINDRVIMEEIFVYFDKGDVFVGGNRNDGRPVFLKDLPKEQQDLVLALGFVEK